MAGRTLQQQSVLKEGCITWTKWFQFILIILTLRGQ